jgi:hypothetical protein
VVAVVGVGGPQANWPASATALNLWPMMFLRAGLSVPMVPWPGNF